MDLLILPTLDCPLGAEAGKEGQHLRDDDHQKE